MANGDDHPVHPGSSESDTGTWSLHCIRIRIPVIFVIAQGWIQRRSNPTSTDFSFPLCSISYETTYWVESLARGFARELEGLDVPLTIQISASEAEADRPRRCNSPD